MNEPQIVWLVSNKVWQQVCATEEDAHTLIVYNTCTGNKI
jgi:hypothetical protein